jgi:hypothetical protein
MSDINYYVTNDEAILILRMGNMVYSPTSGRIYKWDRTKGLSYRLVEISSVWMSLNEGIGRFESTSEPLLVSAVNYQDLILGPPG